MSRIDEILAGNERAAARLMRDLDDRLPSAIAELRLLYPHTGRARVIGVTGNPGAGKSTVVDGLIERYRGAGKRVGVVAVDPTSPFTGGAILGDRIRMQRHATDPGVFIRSLATRGHLGGLSRSTCDVVSVLDAMGCDVVLVETVGVGQDEIDVMAATDTTVVVTVPGLGDDIQAIKAGILEIADVLVVNKADREGADRAVRDLLHMLELRHGSGAREVEIVKTIALRGDGLELLVAAIDRHRVETAGADGRERGRRRAAAQLAELIEEGLAEVTRAAFVERGGIDALADDIAARRTDPYGVAHEIIAALLSGAHRR
ncbi:MAG: methylmalonyl Co-A mutase-associated GTPase MeaB [Myxococcales bacterium]|nr:methylmalonyl Co-A mutase-associated GTPase MeaB [Myxococcales bacterium]